MDNHMNEVFEVMTIQNISMIGSRLNPRIMMVFAGFILELHNRIKASEQALNFDSDQKSISCINGCPSDGKTVLLQKAQFFKRSFTWDHQRPSAACEKDADSGHEEYELYHDHDR
jgi:ABC-type ATPase with predicted acetyltransferase domain